MAFTLHFAFLLPRFKTDAECKYKTEIIYSTNIGIDRNKS